MIRWQRIRMKGNACERLGMESRRIHLPEETTTEEYESYRRFESRDAVRHFAAASVPGILTSGKHLKPLISKDVDGVTSWGYGQTASVLVNIRLAPAAIMKIMEFYGINRKENMPLSGRANTRQTSSALLLNANATVTTCHSIQGICLKFFGWHRGGGGRKTEIIKGNGSKKESLFLMPDTIREMSAMLIMNHATRHLPLHRFRRSRSVRFPCFSNIPWMPRRKSLRKTINF